MLRPPVAGATIAAMGAARSIGFTVYTDVLCPWCYNATVTLTRVRDEVGDVLSLQWKSYLLRPQPQPRSLDAFRRYTQSWMRPAAQPDAGEFQVWSTDEPPPSHSIPPNVAVKAAARQNALERYHLALMHAYFARNRNITDTANLIDVAGECGLDVDRFERDLDDASVLAEVIEDHREAISLDIHGVPCVVVEGGFQLPGAQERAVYKNVIAKTLERRKVLA